ncbi:ras association domain-containing protein 10-like isoform X2 [Neocloeon triangulifer]|uniref:ras association domain-containing protein 10-like isoform X2 n=1 Tax=Neocloeon triangulifer TaxID=2078957 RepID=UPI00286F9913|nr:ras association domain-containing protein 10-like isoform X2 [Neocloeon triangulifer]
MGLCRDQQQAFDMSGGALVMPQAPAGEPHHTLLEPNNNQQKQFSSGGMTAQPAEIPIWINGAQRWISGIGRKTTCDDVIRVLLRSEGCNPENKDKEEKHQNKHYAIVERWKKVERPLDGRSRILKVWTAWGDEQEAVRLTLKRVNPTTPREVKTHHHRRSSRGHNRARLLQTVHPKRLIDGDNKQFSDTIEHLMKLILAQGETIQTQLRRLHDRDEQIIHIEDQVHSSRQERLGSNYLLETYLKDLDANKGGEDDSGVAEVEPAKADEEEEAQEENEEDQGGEGEDAESQRALVETRACIALWERVVRVNKRLEKEEQCLVKLHVKLRRLSEAEPTQEATDLITSEAISIVKEQIEEADALSTAQQMEVEQNDVRLQETCEQLQERHRLLDYLQEELQECELEEQQLKKWLQEAMYKKHQQMQQQQQLHHAMLTKQFAQVTSTPASSTGAIRKQIEGDTDSNSDTGLSSLHSSSEEGVYVLDTLV